ncbi:ABC transporter ATP-binding protein [Oceanidesulfovibrio marinus]|uniref:Glycerol-3-phosphate ABC transporter ATP-binding protein n=1 Tax=Oceanidesulfovibrio marinus TaxID=370038 RepID=A0A6P1ZJ00_9BACT|nr:sn-glycerol-3-phosphate ABC transporter ATP-binding protein UgpC [Oceanidesulfovibrio marinus]TVM35244.1 glycerol-3-phosphate ABC transporter ATP-binding protein [Oceanidesulfovibrio marinus]
MGSVRFEQVTKRFGSVEVIRNMELSIEDGELVVFVGPSGCGKSTMLRLLAGLESVSEGRVYIGGRDVHMLEPKERDIAMVFQNYALYPHMTVRQNIAFGLKLSGLSKPDIERAVAEASSLLGLEELLDRKPRELSGGQRQRVAMGRAIVRKPQVFLMDEPLSNLDAKLRNHMRVEIRKLQQRLSTTMIYVTHDQVEAMTMADRIAIIDGGEVQQFGTPQEVYHRPANIFVADFIGSPAMNFVPASRTDERTLTMPGGLSVEIPAERAAQIDDAGEVLLGIRPEHFQIANGASDDLITWSAPLEMCEPLGGEHLIHAGMGDSKVVVRAPGVWSGCESGMVPLAFDPELAHIFDPAGPCLSHGRAA